MKWRWLLFACCLRLFIVGAVGQVSATKEILELDHGASTVTVPTRVASLLVPILDAREIGVGHNQKQLNNLLYDLTRKDSVAADEALVVLMCFDVGESQEETDAVIGRGKRMLPLLKKYYAKKPKVPGRPDPDPLLKDPSDKTSAFDGAMKAIHRGWHSTADNPAG